MKIIWYTSTTYVHHETGEILDKSVIKDRYKIIHSEEYTNYEQLNYQTYGNRKIIRYVKEKAYQTELEF